MTWKEVLKAPLSEREMAEVREFMPEEMGRRSVQTFLPITRDNEMMSELERRVQSVKSAPPGLQRRSAFIGWQSRSED